MPSPEVTRKRGREGGPDDARPHKRKSLGASASASTPESNSAPAAAAAAKSDPPALTGPPDGHRRYDEWKGVMYGYERIVHGNGAMFPANYQINFNEPEPWTCPLGTCRKPFPQSAQLGAHFSRAHRKLLLVEEIRRGFFWEYGERKNPDKDGRFRSIVVHREFFEPPKHRRFGSDRQPPEDWEMYVNPTAVKDFKPGAPRPPQDAVAPAAPASTTSAAAFVPRPSAALVTATPHSNAINATAARPPRAPAAFTAAPPVIVPTAPRAMRVTHPASRSGREIIDLSSDNEDVKPVVKDTPVRNTVSRVPPPQEQARGKTKNNGAANRVRKNGHGAMFEVNNPQELGGAQHHRNLFASWKQEAGTQLPKKVPSSSSREVGAQRPKDRPLGSGQAVRTQHTKDASPKSNRQQNPTNSEIWKYLMRFLQPGTFFPNDAAVIELLTLSLRRELSRCWRYRLRSFKDLHVTTLTAVILYLGGDESANSPCGFMGCKKATQDVNFNSNYRNERDLDYRFAFSECVVVPPHLLGSKAIMERLKHTICCNSYYRCFKREVPANTPGHVSTQSKEVIVSPAVTEAAKNGNANSIHTKSKDARTDGTKLNSTPTKPNTKQNDPKMSHTTLINKQPHRPVKSLDSQAPLSNLAPMSSAKRIEEQKKGLFSRLNDQSQPSQASTAVSSTSSRLAVAVQETVSPRRATQADSAQWLDSDETREGNSEAARSGSNNGEQDVDSAPKGKGNLWIHETSRRVKEKKTKQKASPEKEEQLGMKHHSSTGQAQATTVSLTAGSLSNATVQDTSTTPSTSQQQSFPENTQEAAIFDPANKSPQFLGLQGEEIELLQASRRHTLECTVVAGSMKVKNIKNGGMAITSRVNAGETWTVDPDSQCLVSNFFPAAQEVAVFKVKSKPVLASKE